MPSSSARPAASSSVTRCRRAASSTRSTRKTISRAPPVPPAARATSTTSATSCSTGSPRGGGSTGWSGLSAPDPSSTSARPPGSSWTKRRGAAGGRGESTSPRPWWPGAASTCARRSKCRTSMSSTCDPPRWTPSRCGTTSTLPRPRPRRRGRAHPAAARRGARSLDRRRGGSCGSHLGRPLAPAHPASPQLLLHEQDDRRAARAPRLRDRLDRAPRVVLHGRLPRPQAANVRRRPPGSGARHTRPGLLARGRFGAAEPVRHRDGRRPHRDGMEPGRLASATGCAGRAPAEPDRS